MKWWQRSFAPGFIAGSLVGMFGSLAIAQSDLLTRAEIYKLVNRVQLWLKNQLPRSVQVADMVQPLDAVKTDPLGRADLVFNEGSLVRLGGNAIFRFVPSSRSFQLRNGTGLLIRLQHGLIARPALTPDASTIVLGQC